ncbi:hypothetical protein COBT_001357 [Conglomerata obtusa]
MNVDTKECSKMYIFYEETLKHIDDYIRMTNIKNEDLSLISQANTSNDSIIASSSPYSSPSKKYNFKCRVGYTKETPQEALQRFIKGKKSEVEKKILMENLRYTILKSIKHVSKNDRNRLFFYHSVIHLIQLILKKENAYHIILNDWLNINFADNDPVTDILRGNFGRIIKKYPEMTEAIEALISEENPIETEELEVKNVNSNGLCNFLKKFFINKTENKFFNNWKQKYEKIIPKDFKHVFVNHFYDRNKSWGDNLCHELLFKYRNNGKFINDVNELREILIEDDIYANIMKEEHNLAYNKVDDWLKLILRLIFNLSDTDNNLECNFEIIAKHIYKIDYKLSLDFFAYSKNANLYFHFILNKIELNFINVFFLYKFALENKFEKEKILELFCSKLFEQKDLYGILSIMNQYNYQYVIDSKDEEEFILFCIKNYQNIKRLLSAKNINLEIYKFILLIDKLKQKELLSIDEYKILLNSRYSINFNDEIIYNVLQLNLEEEMLHFILGKIIKFNDPKLSKYKHIVIEKFKKLNL